MEKLQNVGTKSAIVPIFIGGAWNGVGKIRHKIWTRNYLV